MNTILLISIISLAFNCWIINFFANKLGDFLDEIAYRLKMTSSVKGVLFDGISSSIPELLTSVVAALAVLGVFSAPDPTAFSDVGVGTIGGSAIFNILIIPFLSLLFISSDKVDTLEIDKKAMIRDLTIYLISVGILYIGTMLGELNQMLGIALVVLYSLYALFLIKTGKNQEETTIVEENSRPHINKSMLTLCGIAILTLIPIGISVHMCVEAATKIGLQLHISRMIMSLVVLAATTSIPDTLLSIRSARNGELDASISNAVGSNSFDICIALGLVLAISAISVKVDANDVLFVFKFLILSSICYTLAFMTNTNKNIKMAILFSPYAAFLYYVGVNLNY
nr:hypothetical protein [uncultured Cetobacterium sp.]